MKHLISMSLVLSGLSVMAVPARAETTAPNNVVDQAEVDQALNDLNNRLTEARAVPNFENGNPTGYKVVQPPKGSTYEKLGLKNGDVIKSANGQPIKDPQHAFQILSTSKTTNLEVVRDGAQQNMQVDQQPGSDDGNQPSQNQ